MAKIERFISQGQTMSKAGGVRVQGPAAQGPNVRPILQGPIIKSGLGALGQGITSLGSSMFKVQKAFDEAHVKSEYSGAKVKLIGRLAALESEFKSRQDDENFLEDYDKETGKIYEEISKSFKYQDSKDAFALYNEEMTTEGRISTQGIARDKFVERDKGDMLESLQVLITTANTKDEYEFNLKTAQGTAYDIIDARVSSGVISKSSGVAMKLKFDNAMWSNYIKNQSKAYPISLKALLKDKNSFPGLLPEKREALSEANDIKYAYAMA